jgi:hypothetical protein
LYQRFNPHIVEHDPAGSLPTPVIPLFENSTLIRDLSLDGGLSSQDIQECLRRGQRVTRVVFGKPPPGYFSPPPLINPDKIHPDRFDLRILLVGSVETTLLPRLESLEAYYLSSLSDEDLLEVITSRINAFKRGETAALKVVTIHFQRYRQKDITEDVSRLAKEAGIEVKLDLNYPPESSKLLDRLSTSYGLTSNGGTWPQFTISVFPKFKQIHRCHKHILEGRRINPCKNSCTYKLTRPAICNVCCRYSKARERFSQPWKQIPSIFAIRNGNASSSSSGLEDLILLHLKVLEAQRMDSSCDLANAESALWDDGLIEASQDCRYSL